MAARYENAYSGYLQASASLKQAEKELEEAKRKKVYWEKNFNARVRKLYKQKAPIFLVVLLNAQSLDELLLELKYLVMASDNDAKMVRSMIQAQREWRGKLDHYSEEKQRYSSLLYQLNSEKEALKKKLSLANAMLRAVKSSTSRSPVYRSGSSYRIGSFVFPIAAAHSYTDTFGAPRVGHRHQGTDIFASYGAPVVACVSGVVSLSQGGAGGIMIWLRGNDGNTYFYAHLSGYAPGISSGTRVRSGQVIGYVGNSGNASGGAAHLHFEIHPGGGRAINPYPILRAAD
jgi:murein DD-endopeptidase MepM/ murein hydrolase activator NlpD